MNKLRSVTFDLDGTLLDTAPDLRVACNRMLAEMGQPVRSDAEIRRFVGTGMAVLVTRCLFREKPPAAQEIEQGIAFFKRFYAEENGRTARPYPAVREGLNAWRDTGLPLAVVTNKRLSFTHALLEKTALKHYFQAVVGGDSTPFLKPHPEPICFACRQLQTTPAENLHIGDSIHDAQAARAAGSRAYLVPYGYTEGKALDEANCDAQVSDLLAALRQAQREKILN
jgi:phosphoglycolate phosphatase